MHGHAGAGGCTLAWPTASRSQVSEKRMHHVGILSAFSAQVSQASSQAAVLMSELQRAGHRKSSWHRATTRLRRGLGQTRNFFARLFRSDHPHEVDAALAAIAKSPAQALYVSAETATEPRVADIAAFALRQRLPTIGLGPRLVEAGRIRSTTAPTSTRRSDEWSASWIASFVGLILATSP